MTAYFNFSDELQKLLLSLDKQFVNEQPEFDYDYLSQRIDEVIPRLERIVGLTLERRDAQDAFYFSDVGCWKERIDENGAPYYCSMFLVRFSLYGNLTTMTFSCPDSIVDEQIKKKVVRCLEEYDFIFIDENVLMAKYNGKHEYFLENNLTWWDRFFEYE